MTLIRRANHRADQKLAAMHEADRLSRLDRDRRADERRQLRLIHDTALTTLTLVGVGAVDWSPGLAAQATTDLQTLTTMAQYSPPSDTHDVQLDRITTRRSRKYRQP